MVFFSVITPNYNSGDKLIRAIESLKGNSISYEHIIIDDCSTDESFLNAKKKYGANSGLSFLKNKYNSGPGVSRNKGLDAAKGIYILFLDADDYLTESALDILYSSIISNNLPDILTFRYRMINSLNKGYPTTKCIDSAIAVESPIEDYLLDKIISSPWGKCIKSELAKSNRFPNLEVGEDAIYNLNIFVNSKSVFNLPCALYNFDKTEDNTLTRKVFNLSEFEKLQDSWELFEKDALNKVSSKKINMFLSGRKIRFCALYYINRMIITPDSTSNKIIIKSIRSTIIENILPSKGTINNKVRILCLLFLFFPNTTLELLKKIKPNGL